MPSKVKDPTLAKQGKMKIALAEKEMPVLEIIKKDFTKDQPFKGLTIAACLHVTKETAVLMKALKAGGATVALCGSNPLSTQDDVAAALAEEGVNVFAWRGITDEKYYWCVNKVLDFHPQIIVDDGADLISVLHKERKAQLKEIFSGQEETTTGVIRLKAMAKDGKLKFPVVAINDTPTKHMFDNYYGTGQSTLDSLFRATNILLAGKTVVVAGYGYCGKGIALRAKGMGAKVIVTEIDPLPALQAAMDGFEVMPMLRAAKLGDVFITVTGNKDVITKEHIAVMKDGAILGNSGHFNVEINEEHLKRESRSMKQVRDNLMEYEMSDKSPKGQLAGSASGGKDGRKIYLIGEGRLMNLAAAEGHPSAVMDLSFADQALMCEWLSKNYQGLEKGKVLDVPKEVDEKVSKLKLQAMNIIIDELTPAQKKYLASWQEGT